MAENDGTLKPDDIPDVQTVQRIAAEQAAESARIAKAEADRQRIRDRIENELAKDPVLAQDQEGRQLLTGEVWNKLRADPANRTLSDAEFWKKVEGESAAIIKREEERSAKRAALKAAETASSAAAGSAALGEGERSAATEARGAALSSSVDDDGEPQFGPGTDWSKSNAQIESERARRADKFLKDARRQKV